MPAFKTASSSGEHYQHNQLKDCRFEFDLYSAFLLSNRKLRWVSYTCLGFSSFVAPWGGIKKKELGRYVNFLRNLSVWCLKTGNKSIHVLCSSMLNLENGLWKPQPINIQQIKEGPFLLHQNQAGRAQGLLGQVHNLDIVVTVLSLKFTNRKGCFKWEAVQ